MTSPDATRHVVERCPRCGAEHDASPGAVCEACDTPLRPWCRVHGGETGWLDGPACARCAEDAARPARRAPAWPALPCPAPSMPATIPAASSPAPGGAPPGRVAAEHAAPPKPLRPVEHWGVMLLTLLLSTGSVTLLSVVAAFVYLLSGRGTLPDTALRFAAVGATLGLLLGVVCCVHYLTTLRTPPPAP